MQKPMKSANTFKRLMWIRIIGLIIFKKMKEGGRNNYGFISMNWKMEAGALKFGLIDFQKDKFSG